MFKFDQFDQSVHSLISRISLISSLIRSTQCNPNAHMP